MCRKTGVDAMLNTSKLLFIGCFAVTGMNGCVMVPVASDGSALYPMAAPPVPSIVVPVATVTPDLKPLPPRPRPPAGPIPSAYAPPPSPYAPPVFEVPGPAGPAAPAALQARLYPSNEVATETGMLSGTVTNMMTGKGFFQLNYRGEILSGEATRVPGDDRRGLANAYGQHGTYMTCDYRMTTPYLGTGTCSLSNGAQYQVHIGG
jgi:hypothetical protein